MKPKRSIRLFILAGSLLLAGFPPASARPGQKGGRVLAVKVISGRMVGFQRGDYLHVDVRKTDGARKSFFIFRPGLDYFLALHKQRAMTFTYEVANVIIPENGGITRVERLVSASVGSLKFESWWKTVTAKNSLEELDDKYGPLVLKYERK